ncbi:patatin-like phospholipase family protein [Pseudoalteromonas sp. APC 3358]|uniref:patatin-like phospholipase family protein n=1 Tax=Pseudoalteromonas sp. APC 3358 TaxID=3035176 RepID=UPI0025B3B3C9|nr:patatin-like phospholipase family protein [Pseudoalteromonas sp. APC 3358]MDN3385117.1 patatin-like phospholipase family protein [Pseudoalteromonas sp. APC 3358]
MRSFKLIFTTCLVLNLVACASVDRTHQAAPAESYRDYEPVHIPIQVRSFAVNERGDVSFKASDYSDYLANVQKGDPLHILALSGGGQNGAFGAGILKGWTSTGQRPQFDIVTGISTGALIAPFAFLGPEYDDRLERLFTQTSTRDIAKFRIVSAFLFGGQLGNTAPLRESIERELTDDMLREIGRELDNGRELLIGTTNLDAGRAVIWSIGEIARIGTPEAFDLIRKIILASASIPVVFEPVFFEVTDGKEVRKELHVDGALTQKIFTYPDYLPVRQFLEESGLSRFDNKIWLIHNNKLSPTYEAQSTNLVSVLKRTVKVLVQSQSFGNIVQILATAKRDGFSVNGLTIPDDFDEEPTEVFDPAYMKKLHSVGEQIGSNPESWYMELEHYFDQIVVPMQ